MNTAPDLCRSGRAVWAAALAALLLTVAPARGQDRDGPAVAPPAAPPTVPAEPRADELPDVTPVAPQPEPVQDQVYVRRLSDVVAVRIGQPSVERVLYYFNPSLYLAQADHLEQGSGGQSDIVLPGGAFLQLYASAHAEFALLSPEGDVVRLPLLTRLDAGALDRPLNLILPGGTQVRFQNSTLQVQVDPGRMRIRNTGSSTVTVTGDLRLHPSGAAEGTPGQLELLRGEEVLIPLFRLSGGELGTVTNLWGLLTVRHQRGLKLDKQGGVLRLHRDAGDVASAGDAVLDAVEEASIGGVTTRWLPGSSLTIVNPRHQEPPPAPAVEPPPPMPAEETPSAPATEPPLAPADEPPPAEADDTPEPGAGPEDESADEPADASGADPAGGEPAPDADGEPPAQPRLNLFPATVPGAPALTAKESCP